MERLFAVLRSRGPAWDDSKPLEGQAEWAGHAAFMDALFEQRFAVLVGPLEGTRDALLIIRASSTSEIVERLASDPWTTNGLLMATPASPGLRHFSRPWAPRAAAFGERRSATVLRATRSGSSRNMAATPAGCAISWTTRMCA